MAFDLNMEEIMDHYKSPHNKRDMGDATHTCHESNPLCGDDLNIFIKVSKGVVKDISFTGSGCAISMASASMLTEKLKGMKSDDVLKLGTDDIVKMLGIELTAVRVKCAVLGLVAAKNAIKGDTRGKSED